MTEKRELLKNNTSGTNWSQLGAKEYFLSRTKCPRKGKL